MRTRTRPTALPAPHTVLVVGGSGGIGSAIVRVLAGVCDTVIFTYHRRQEEAEQLQGELREAPARIVPVQVALDDSAQWGRVLNDLVDRYDIDLLVNSAGISIDRLCIDSTIDEVQAQFQVNVFAAWQAMSVIGRDMVFHHRGRIINIASIAATENSPGRSVYGSTKAALVSLTRSFAAELGRFDVRVNAIAPGFVDTELIGGVSQEVRDGFTKEIPLGRFATTAEVGEIVRFLILPESSYLHGSVITIDGGTSA